MPSSRGIVRLFLSELCVLLLSLACMLYADWRSSGEFWVGQVPLGLVDYYCCALVLITACSSLLLLHKSRFVNRYFILALHIVTIFCVFLVSGLYACAVAFEVC